jgi:hypothetical protein
MQRQPLLMAAFVTASVTLAGPVTLTARADVPDKPICEVTGHYYDGGYTLRSQSIYGARALIDKTNNPYFCPDNGTTYATVLVGSNVCAPGPFTFHAQVGTGIVQGHSRAIASEYTKKCCGQPECDPPYVRSFDPAPGGPLEYEVYQRGSDGHVVMRAGGNVVDETGYNVSGDWDTAWTDQFFGETWDVLTYMPGTSSSKVRFQELQRYEENGDINYIQTGDLYWTAPQPNYERDQVPGDPHPDFRIWDSRG